MGEGFDAYTVRREGLSCKVDELVAHFVMAFDDKPPVILVESVMHRKWP